MSISHLLVPPVPKSLVDPPQLMAKLPLRMDPMQLVHRPVLALYILTEKQLEDLSPTLFPADPGRGSSVVTLDLGYEHVLYPAVSDVLNLV